MFKNRFKRIENVAVKGVATLALIAPLVLSGASANASHRTHARHADTSEIVRHAKRNTKKGNRKTSHLTRRQHWSLVRKANYLKRDMKANSKKIADLKAEEARMSSSKGMKKSMGMSSMMNMHGTRAPKGLKQAKHPKFHKGSRIVIKASHMPGMKGAKGNVVGAYNTKLYAVNYKPTNHGKPVRNHKWVVSAEMRPSTHLRVGKRVILKANHMKFMKGAKAKIVGVHNGPAYMVNYRQTTNHVKVTNHKWLTQSELAK